jgi:hypothetical protein
VREVFGGEEEGGGLSLRYTRGLGWRIHFGVEVTESSTNKQHINECSHRHIGLRRGQKDGGKFCGGKSPTSPNGDKLRPKRPFVPSWKCAHMINGKPSRRINFYYVTGKLSDTGGWPEGWVGGRRDGWVGG